MASSKLPERTAKSKHILWQIVRAILFLARQGLALRGDIENHLSHRNPGDFLALLTMMAESDSVPHNHLSQLEM